MRTIIRWRCRLVIALGLAALCAAPSPAAEPSIEFLEALRNRGFHDMALEYLEAAKTSRLVDPALKNSIQYELGVTYMDYARIQRSEKARDEYYAKAAAELTAFVKANAAKPTAIQAMGRLAELAVSRANTRIAAAAKPGTDPAKPLAEAKAFFDEATSVLTERKKIADAAYAKFKGFDPKKDKDKEKEKERDEAQAEVVSVQLQLALVDYYRAKMHKVGSAEFKKQLKVAADAYHKIYDDYKKTSFGAVKAYFLEGKCYQDMGDLKQALVNYDECLGIDNDFREFKTEVMIQACECWIDPAIGTPAKADERGGEWLVVLGGADPKDADVLSLRYLVARAKELMLIKANDPKTPKAAPNSPGALTATQKAGMKEDIMKHARAAANGINPYRKKAQELLDRMVGSSGPKDRPEPKSFAEAKERGDELFGSIRSKMELIDISEENLKNPQLPEAEAKETQKNIDDAKKAILTMRPEAAEYYGLALSLAKPTDKIDDVNLIRYSLCLLHYQRAEEGAQKQPPVDGDAYYDAALIGEFLLRRFPQSPGGKNAAKIALACWSKLNSKRLKAKEDNKYELAQMGAIAGAIRIAWTDKETADETNVLLVTIFVEQGDYAAAEAAMAKVSPDNPRLAAARLALGQALARAYFAKKVLPADQRPPEAELSKLADQAKGHMEAGIKQMEEAGTVTPALISAVYALAQTYLDDSQNDKTIALIENAKYGPLALIKAKSPLVSPPNFNPKFQEFVYKLALRAYIGAIGQRPELLDKAEQIIGILEKTVDAKELMFSYTTMAGELQKQLKAAPEAQKQSIAAGYVKFLMKMRDSGSAQKYDTMAYILKSFEGLADGFDDEGKEPSKQAKTYYAEAVKTGEKLLALAKDGTITVDENSLLGVQAVLARCAGMGGDYETALGMYDKILAAKPFMLKIQADAAMNYQAWGRQDPKYYRYALKGGRPGAKVGEKASIWGWERLSTQAMKNEKFAEYFHEARYQMAVCYYEVGKATTAPKDKSKRTIYLTNSKKATQSMYSQYPQMGGEERKAQYEKLMRQVQQELGEKAVGLKEFDVAPAGQQAAG